MDAVKEMKKRNRHFSFRYIARHLELRSSGYFNLVVHGKRKLSEPLAHKTAALLKLSDKEREYFLYLIQYTTAKSEEEQHFCFERMSSLRSRHVKKVVPSQYMLYSKWFYNVIREMIPFFQSFGDFRRMGKTIRPNIHAKEVREAIKILKKIGMIEEVGKNNFRQIQPLITTGDEWDSAFIHQYQRTLIDMSRNALDTIAKEERDISSLMLPVSGRTFNKMREELKKLRQKFLAFSQEDAEADTVYVCAMQLFPVTQSFKEKKL
jgi:uncharacterized protein (TIGR02147 family)